MNQRRAIGLLSFVTVIFLLFAAIMGLQSAGVQASNHQIGEPASQDNQATKQTIIFGDLNWSSALLQNRIAQYIVEKGYGYPTDVKFGATLPLFQGLRRGDTHVLMEIWLPNQNEAWNEARAEGAVLSLGQSLGTDWQSAFVIPKYLQEQYPELDSVEDLKAQQYKDLFKTAETGDKARLVSCVIDWACEEVNAAQVEGYGLSDHVEIVNPGDGAALNADLYGAYERKEPWLGYQWGTNGPALQLDLVRLEEPAYSDQCWFTTKACAYQDSTVLIAVYPDLPAAVPDVTNMLRKWDFNVDIYKTVVRWQAQYLDAGTEDTAIWWMNSNPDIWGEWVTAEAEASIKAALAAGEIPDGWPVERTSIRPAPHPTATPTPVPADDEVLNRLSLLEELVAALQGLIAALDGRLATLEERTIPQATPTPTPIPTVTPTPTTQTPIPTSTPQITATPEPGAPTDDCVQTIDSGSVNGRWSSDCLSEKALDNDAREVRYARFYIFTLDAGADVVITLASEQDTYLRLLEGAGKDGEALHENDDFSGLDRSSRIATTLAAGDYTIEATTYEPEKAGDFTLTLEYR